VREHGITPRDADTLLSEPELADYFEEVAAGVGDGREAASWVLSELLHFWHGKSPPVPATELSELIRRVRAGKVSRTNAKELLEEAIGSGKPLLALLERKDLAQISDEEKLRRLAQDAISDHPQAAADFRAGKAQALGFLVGQVMRKTKGRADAKKLSQILRELLTESEG